MYPLPWSRRIFLERKAKVLEENYQLLSNAYAKNKKLYHDMNHHLQMIYYLAKKENNTEIMEYVDSITLAINRFSDMIWSGVGMLDAILNYTIAEAKKKNIRMEINVEFPQNSNISPDDLCVIFFNLLDNAIEATESWMHKNSSICGQELVITVTIRRIQQFLLIKVKNPSLKRKKNGLGLFLSTKSNPAHHGIGLKNVRETAEKYNGNVELEECDGEMITSVLLFFHENTEDGN